ncbi:MAG: C1 family peptidase [bacterium]
MAQKLFSLIALLFSFSSPVNANVGLSKSFRGIIIAFDSQELNDPIGCVYIDSVFLTRLTPQEIRLGEVIVDTTRFSKRLAGKRQFRIGVIIEGYSGNEVIRKIEAGKFSYIGDIFNYLGGTTIENNLQEFIFKRFAELRQVRVKIKEEGALWKADLTAAFMVPDSEICGLFGLKPLLVRIEGIPMWKKGSNLRFPPQLDWTNKEGINWMTKVKEQSLPGKSCGSCWAFGTVGQVEALINITTNTPNPNFDLAEQTLVSDCCRYCGDCTGGMNFWALMYIKDSGIPLESVDPYASENGLCDKRPSQLLRISSYSCVVWKDYTHEDAIKSALETNLLSTGLHADYQDFLAYAGGVFTTPDSARYWHPDHCVVLVGWNDNDEGGIPTWKIKNSWGEDWGENGYMRIKRGIDSLGVYTFDADYVPGN